MPSFFSTRSKKAAEKKTTEVPGNNGTVTLPNLDLEKAATKVEAGYRGLMARKSTKGLKAHREAAAAAAAPAAEESSPLAALTRCFPCLAPQPTTA